jgi:4-carboxymuconolactone decarboxylase
MTRTPFLSPEEMSSAQRHIYDDIVASRGTWLNGPYAPMLHQPKLADPAQKLGEFLRYKTSLPPSLSELSILVVARHWDCDFEWHQHAPIAVRSDVLPDIVEAIRNDREPTQLNEAQGAVYAFTRALLEEHFVPDSIYDRVKSLFGVVGAVELTALVGYYTLIAFTLNAHQVPLPAGASPPLPARERCGASA